MNMKPEKNAELRALVDAMCENTITEQQTARLEEIISADESAMEFYIQAMWLDDGIRRSTSGFISRIDAAKFETQNTNPDSFENDDDDMVSAAAQQNVWSLETESQVSGIKWLYSGVAILGLFLITILVLWIGDWNESAPLALIPNVKAPETIAQELQDRTQPRVALNIDSKGLDRQELSDGTIVIARPGAKYVVDKPRELALASGDLYLIVAKSDQPFVVKTSDGEVLATGTRFTVSTGEKTDAAVAQGQVVLKSTAGTINLGVGQEGTLTRNQQPTRRPAKRLSYQVNWAKDALKQDELLVPTNDRENGLIAIDPYGQEARLTLRKYNVDVYIEDGIARTTIDQTFFNHNPWNTEGTFYFPLPPDASVSRLAMYVAGQLNEGGMVSRQRGQEIYTEILYQRRDPALLEMMEGNMFKMRIFPLEGRQEKRIFLSYTQNLDELYGTLKYWFPMDHTQDLANELSIRVRVKNGAKQFDPGSSTHDVKLSTEGDDLVMEYAAKKIKPDQDFLLSLLPKKDAADQEVRVSVCEHEGQNYLSAKLIPNLTSDFKPEPRQWIVINDVSASRSKVDIQAQRYVLERLITEADDDDSVFLMDLNTKARNVSVKPVNVRSGQVKPLLNHRPGRLIGATNIAAGLDAVQEIIREHKLNNPHVVYLGDGIATDGEKAIAELPRLIPNRCKFVGIGIGKKIDSMFLQEAANRTGGLFATINPNEDIDWRVFDLLAALNTPRMNNIRVALLDENDQPMETIAYPSSTVIAAGETLTVTAMCDKKLPAKIRFTGNVDQRPVTITATIKEAKTGARYLPRLWAKQHIDSLLKSGMANEEEIIALSKAFYVVTPFTSLIVLEDDAMYEQYDVERGRKDHWATYAAPKTIDVVKEPVDWNQWGWGRNWSAFEGEDAKIDANTQPKTIQEIVDGIQIRINAPFYLWQETPQDSRTGLYQICDSKLESSADTSRWLTLWFLMASGQQQTAMDWSRGISNASSDSTNGSLSSPPATDEPFGASIRLSIANSRGWQELVRFKSPRDITKFRMLQGFSPRTESIIEPRYARMLGDGYRTLPEMGMKESKKMTVVDFLQRASAVPDSTGLESQLAASFDRAVSNRWSRIQRDISKYNSQQNRWGGWDHWNTWDSSIDLNGNGNPNLFGNGLQGILDVLEAGGEEFRPLMDQLGDLTSDSLSFPLQQAATSSLGTVNFFMESWVVPGEGFRGGPAGALLPELTSEFITELAFTEAFTEAFRKKVTRRRKYTAIRLHNEILPASQFLAASQRPAHNQPGMAAVLAADHLHKRLTELTSESVLDKSQLAEKKAIEVAIAKMDRVGAGIESSGMFWGYSGWSYQPRPESIQPPTIQAYPGYAWSYDLTRYASGLYSTEADMIHEVSKRYGNRKPNGKLDDATRKLIDESRSKFQPVSIKLDADESELLVGPNDQFAITQRSDMYLTENLICDGANIHHVYDELGMSARREASESQLNVFRQMVPHMIAPADLLTEQFDVELVNSDDDTFTLKLTIAEPPTDIDAKTDPDASGKPTSHLLITVDHQGRVLNRKWMIDDKTILILNFNYQNDNVEVAWSLPGGEEPEAGTLSYQAKRFTPKPETFTADLDQLVVIDMPLKKPSYYATELQELKASNGDTNPDEQDGDTNPDQVIPLRHGVEAARLLRHQILAHIQDMDGNRWGQGNAAAIALTLELFKLHERFDNTPKKGDVTLCGSSGIQISQTPEIRDQLNEHASLKDTPLVHFFQYRHNWEEQAKLLKDEKGLVGHLTGTNRAMYADDDKYFESFVENYPDSPLRLAIVSSYHRGFKLDRLLKLVEDPDWSSVALLTASNHCSTPEDNQKFAAAFWKWQEALSDKDQQPVMLDVVFRKIKSIDPENEQKITKLLEQQFESIKQLDSLPALLDFAERISSWGESKLADEAYSLARAKLELDQNSEVPLLRRFAFAQSLWAGNRYKPAAEQFDLIMNSLGEKQIPLSPSFCAAMARLAQQSGDLEKSVRLEEQALELAQPYLPSAINLQAFRQRYQWLWNQYVVAAGKIDADDPERKAKIESLVRQAKKTWDRWQEVDRDNSGLPIQMATFLKSTGDDEEAWEFLSSVIDQRPKDAGSYSQVGQWYQEQGNKAAAARWFGEAPQWDTANPQWLYQYGSALKELGRKSEANIQFNKIINGTWAPGLQNWVDQARNAL